MIRTGPIEPAPMTDRVERTPPVGVQWHPYADVFPWIEGPAFEDLKADIAKNGVLDPIVFLGEYILDGRNRYMAARDLGIEYPRVEYTGDDPLGFVIAKNLARRHLTDRQRADVAAKLSKLPRGRPAENPSIGGITAEQAAKLMDVPVKAVERAKAIQEHGAPELQAAYQSGAVSQAAAAEVAKLPAEEQVKAVETGAVKDIAKDQREARKAAKAAEQSNNDEFQAKSKASLPPDIRAAEAAKTEAISARKSRVASDALSAEIDELREALTAVETENVALKQDIRRFDDMRVQWEQGGFEAVIAGKDEEIRVLKTRVERESGDKAAWARSAKAGWKAAREHGYTRDIIIDLSTGQERV